MISYDEILENMKNEYFDICHQKPDMDSEMGVKFKVIATELFNLSVNADYILKQCRWQTATGEYLDRIATECSITRKAPSKASGVLTFSIDEPRTTDLEIPVNTICSKKGYKYLQYKTTKPATIFAGELFCEVEAEALDCGKEYNAGYGDITAMINPPTGVNSVINKVSFVGGWDAENDDALRQRVEKALKYPANGINIEFLEGRIMEMDNIVDCRVVRDEGKIIAYVKTRNGSVSWNEDNAIHIILAIFEYFGVEVEVREMNDE